jgi:hypothetical protein
MAVGRKLFERNPAAYYCSAVKAVVENAWALSVVAYWTRQHAQCGSIHIARGKFRLYSFSQARRAECNPNPVVPLMVGSQTGYEKRLSVFY